MNEFMQTQHDNNGPGATARAETEARAPTPKPRHSSRPKPPRFLYVLDYEKRFPGTNATVHRGKSPLPRQKVCLQARFAYKCAMPEQTEPLAKPIRFQTNVIIPDANAPGGSRFIVGGDDSPYRDIAEVPVNLRPLIVSGEPAAPEEPNVARGNFEMGVAYQVTDDNRLGRVQRRSVDRQIAQMEAQNDYQEQLEEEAAADELPPEVAESLQASHEDAVAFAKAQAAVDAARADAASDAAAEAAQPPELYVKRGGRHYAPALKARLKPGEEIFIKDPLDGSFVFIGTTDSRADLPEPPITIT